MLISFLYLEVLSFSSIQYTCWRLVEALCTYKFILSLWQLCEEGTSFILIFIVGDIKHMVVLGNFLKITPRGNGGAGWQTHQPGVTVPAHSC